MADAPDFLTVVETAPGAAHPPHGGVPTRQPRPRHRRVGWVAGAPFRQIDQSPPRRARGTDGRAAPVAAAQRSQPRRTRPAGLVGDGRGTRRARRLRDALDARHSNASPTHNSNSSRTTEREPVMQRTYVVPSALTKNSDALAPAGACRLVRSLDAGRSARVESRQAGAGPAAVLRRHGRARRRGVLHRREGSARPVDRTRVRRSSASTVRSTPTSSAASSTMFTRTAPTG